MDEVGVENDLLIIRIVGESMSRSITYTLFHRTAATTDDEARKLPGLD
jgi:hypothetical protein